jgi:hypothetical protein
VIHQRGGVAAVAEVEAERMVNQERIAEFPPARVISALGSSTTAIIV